MKIAITCATDIWQHDRFAGAEKTVGYRAKALDEMGHEVHLYAGADWPFKPKYGQYFKWDGNKDIINDKMKEEYYDIIDNNGSTEFDTYRVINTIQGPFWPSKNVVAISNSQGVGMGFKSFKVGYYGVDTERYSFCGDKADYFIYFGRAYHGKRPDIAVKLAIEMGFNLKLVCEDKDYCDDRQYVEMLQKMCEGHSNIEYVGPRFGSSLVGYIQKAKGFIFPSDHGEAFGLVQTEALACGTPVIAGGRSGASPEIIIDGKTGFLCKDFDNFTDFKDAIRNIDRIDPRECRKDCEERWSARANALRYLELYGDVISGLVW